MMLKSAAIKLLDFYQYFSKHAPSRCRFSPSCSQYAKESIQNMGIIKGIFFSAVRISKCHPFHPGGYDPAPGSCNNNKGR